MNSIDNISLIDQHLKNITALKYALDKSLPTEVGESLKELLHKEALEVIVTLDELESNPYKYIGRVA